VTTYNIAAPTWRADLPEPQARTQLSADLGAWIRSEPLTALASAWGAVPPLNAGDRELYQWYDELSEEYWDFRQGAERNQARRADLTLRQEDAALATATALGLVEARPPSRQDYDHVLILGGLVRACVVRPAYAARLAQEGATFGNITALGGFRPLRGDELDLATALGVTADNEMDAMVQGTARAFALGRDPEMRRSHPSRMGNGDWAIARFAERLDISVIAAPSSDAAVRRANTADTLVWWAEQQDSIEKSHILLITTAIYVPYQEAGAIRTLAIPHHVTVETVGVPADIADLGPHTQPFGPDNYLQEIRSAISGYRDLLSSVWTEDS
jgi:hypothetical protein